MSKKRASRKRSKTGSAPLFDSKKNYLLSSNWTIARLFSRGCIFSSNADDHSQIPSIARLGAKLPIFSEGIPPKVVNEVAQLSINAFPIALQIADGVKPAAFKFENESVEVLEFKDVQKVIFRTKEDRQEFESRDFENYDVSASGMPLSVDETVFTAKSQGPGNGKEAEILKPMKELEDKLERAEEFGALMAVVIGNTPAVNLWFQALTKGPPTTRIKTSEPITLTECLQLMKLGTIGSSPAKFDDIESLLLSSAVDVLRNYPLSAGWPSEQVLGDIVKQALATSQSNAQLGRGINKWRRWCAGILSHRNTAIKLEDNEPERMVRFAIMYLLLRGDMQSVASFMNHNGGMLLPVGKNVGTLASCLAAIRIGISAMPSSYKSNGDASVLTALGSLVTYAFGFMSSKDGKTKWPLQVKRLDKEWKITANKKTVVECPVKLAPRIDELAKIATSCECEVQRTNEHSIEIETPLGTDNRTKIVRVRSVFNPSGGDFTRFSAIVEKASKTKSAQKYQPLSTNGMTKTQLCQLGRMFSPDSVPFSYCVNKKNHLEIRSDLFGDVPNAKQKFKNHLANVAKFAIVVEHILKK